MIILAWFSLHKKYRQINKTVVVFRPLPQYFCNVKKYPDATTGLKQKN